MGRETKSRERKGKNKKGVVDRWCDCQSQARLKEDSRIWDSESRGRKRRSEEIRDGRDRDTTIKRR